MSPQNQQANGDKPKRINTILMVDDDQVSLNMFQDFFESRGHKFVSVLNPGTLLQHIKKDKPDIIIIEIFMDKIRGDAIIRSLRKKGLKTPIIVVSTRLDKNILVGLKNYDISDFFNKPVSFGKLHAKIKSIIASKNKITATKMVQTASGKNIKRQPLLLVISENQEIINDPHTFVPANFIDKYGLRIITRADCSDSVEALKNPVNNIRMIMVDASHEARTLTMVNLLKVIVSKMGIPVFFIADDFSRRMKNSLSQHGFDNIISKSAASADGGANGIGSQLSGPGKGLTAKAYRQRRTIIKDLKAIKSLPPLPDIYLKIEKLAKNKNSTPNDYSQVLELDPNITARLLRMSNSAHFSFKRKINSVRDAVALMGIHEILSLVRLACITGNLKAAPNIESAVRKVWNHSAYCAVASRLIFERTDICKIPKLGDDLFVCGIIHDIGKIILWEFFTDAYMSFMLDAKKGVNPQVSDEEKKLGATHCEVGKILADHWKLPDSLIEVIAFHHTPMNSPDSELVMVTHISDFICHYIQKGDTDGTELFLDNALLEKIGYTREKVIELGESLGPVIKDKAEVTTSMIMG